MDVNSSKQIIIGAGLAGLAAALQFKKQGIPFAIYEAAPEIGGRVKSHVTNSGTILDQGAHWMHLREEDPLFALAQQYQLPIDTSDTCNNVNSYLDGAAKGSAVREKMLESLSAASDAKAVTLSDALGAGNASGRFYSKLWMGIERPEDVSFDQVWNDPNSPGGYALRGGLNTLVQKMADEVGRENIIINSPVRTILNNEETGVILYDGTKIIGEKVTYTGSIALLKNGKIGFQSPLQADTTQTLDQFNTAHLTKVMYELEADYFSKYPANSNRHVDILDGEPQLFCHIGVGYTQDGQEKPIMTVFFGGDSAKEIETKSNQEITAIIVNSVKLTSEFADFPSNTVGEPFVTKWNSDPYVGCAYSAMKPIKFSKTGPITDGKVTFAGEAFPPVNEQGESVSTGYASGAYLSGQKAAFDIIQNINQQQENFMTTTEKQAAYAKFFETHIDSGVTEGLFQFVDASVINKITNPNSLATLVQTEHCRNRWQEQSTPILMRLKI